jgi:hypothetical protein
MRGLALTLGLMCCAAVVACHSSTTTPTTTTPAPTLTTTTFTGTVGVRSSDTNTFTVSQTGEVDVTLTSTTPASSTMGLGLGTGSASSCSLLPGGSTSAQPGSSPQLTGKLTPGSVCVQVYDLGSDTGPVTYTLTVSHP